MGEKSKGTEKFKQTIKEYLDSYALQDPMFAVNAYSKPNKNIDECVDYIISEVQKSGCMGFHDDEIYAMAIHYYDEDNLGEIKATNAKVVVNHHIELTEEEKEELRQKAKDDFLKEMMNEQRKKNSKPKPEPAKPNAPQQLSLF